MFDKVKMKLIMEMLEQLAPELEFKVVDKIKIKFKGDKEAKEWMAFLIRQKAEKDEKKDH